METTPVAQANPEALHLPMERAPNGQATDSPVAALAVSGPANPDQNPMPKGTYRGKLAMRLEQLAERAEADPGEDVTGPNGMKNPWEIATYLADQMAEAINLLADLSQPMEIVTDKERIEDLQASQDLNTMSDLLAM